MRKREDDGNLMQKRLLSSREAAAYLGLGLTSTRRFCDSIGATRRFGSRVLFDRLVIDKALDEERE